MSAFCRALARDGESCSLTLLPEQQAVLALEGTELEDVTEAGGEDGELDAPHPAGDGAEGQRGLILREEERYGDGLPPWSSKRLRRRSRVPQTSILTYR